MKLATINRWLRRIGLVLVVSIPTRNGVLVDAPIYLWLERAKRYDARNPDTLIPQRGYE